MAESPALLPGLMLVAVLGIWSYRDGGYAVTDWGAGALFVVALVLVLWLVAPVSASDGRGPWVAAGLLAAFTGWSYLSIAWAEVPSEAWTGANRTLLYLGVFLLVIARPWRPAGAAVLLGSYSVAIGVVALVSFWRVVDDVDVAGSFTEGRLAAPIAYANATCALYVAAALPALYLASRREVPVVLRGVFLALVGVLAELALLTQSRASLVAVPVILVAYFILVPGRVRTALTLVLVSLVVVSVVPRLLEVYEILLSGGDAGAVLRDARAAVLRTAIVLLLLGTVAGLVDRRVRIPARLSTVSSRALLGLAAVAVAGVVVVGLLTVAHPVARAQAAWDNFRSEDYVTDPGTPHLTSGFGSSRYRLWLVAADQFTEHPIVGVGGDNFSVTYLRERDDQAQPRYPHSVILRTLAQTGLVGALLLGGFLVASCWALWPRLRHGAPFTRGVAAVSALVFGYWFLHGAIDWFWEIPALGAPAFAFLALALRIADPGASEDVRSPSAGRRPLAVGVMAVAVAAGASLAFPWLSARQVDVAAETWRADPEEAFARLDRARALNPLSDEPDVIAAVIASRVGDERRQERSLRQALARNPSNWYPMVELAALESRRARPRRAMAWLERAHALNPREPTISVVRQALEAGEAVTSAELQEMYVDQATLLTGKRQKW